MNDPSPVTAVFVYGTLKRGQCRQQRWPVEAVGVEPGFVRGQLYDLGPYPALLAGDDWVGGELWRLAAADMPRALRVLDRVEGYAQGGQPDLFRREVVPVYARPEGPILERAYVYRLQDQRMIGGARRVHPASGGPDGPDYAEWPAAVSS